MIEHLIAKAISDNVTAAAALATYDFGSGNEAAAFCCPVIPGDATLPACIVDPVSGDADGNRCHGAWWAYYDVRVYDVKERSEKRVRDAALAIIDALHRATVNGGTLTAFLSCGSTQRLADPDGYQGLRIPIRAYVERV